MLYGKQSLSYNVHVLLHLYEFVQLHGTLDSFSCFPYENYLLILKRRVKKTRWIFKHTLNQINDIRSLYIDSTVSDLVFSHLSPNNCAILSDGSVLVVSNINGNLVSGTLLAYSRDLYSYPYPSKILGIGFYSLSRTRLCHVAPFSKAICIPHESEYIILPYV